MADRQHDESGKASASGDTPIKNKPTATEDADQNASPQQEQDPSTSTQQDSTTNASDQVIPKALKVEPTSNDILFGQAQASHPGNQSFLTIVQANASKYKRASTETDRRRVVWEVSRAVTSFGRMLRQVANGWVVANERFVLAKTRQALKYSVKERKRQAASNRRANTQSTENAAQVNAAPKTDTTDNTNQLENQVDMDTKPPARRPAQSTAQPLLSDEAIMNAIGYYFDAESGEYRANESDERYQRQKIMRDRIARKAAKRRLKKK
jgi:hypothetical protein